MIDIFLRIEPEPPRVTYQQKRFGGVAKDGKTPLFFEPQRLVNARALFMGLLSKHRPSRPFAKAVKMEVMWIFKGKAAGYFIKRPDCDNLQKILQDCMSDLNFWTDDSIVMPSITKIQMPEDAQHGIRITLTSLEGEEDVQELPALRTEVQGAEQDLVSAARVRSMPSLELEAT